MNTWHMNTWIFAHRHICSTSDATALYIRIMFLQNCVVPWTSRSLVHDPLSIGSHSNGVLVLGWCEIKCSTSELKRCCISWSCTDFFSDYIFSIVLNSLKHAMLYFLRCWACWKLLIHINLYFLSSPFCCHQSFTMLFLQTF